MVKGNKERRQELARRRREDEAFESERRKGGPELATPAEVRARLLSDAKALGGSEEGLHGWVVQPASENGVEPKAWCEDFFRTGACLLKRCKNSHETTIAGLKNVPPLPGADIAVAARGRSVSPAARRVRASSAERGSAETIASGKVGGGGGGGAAAAAASGAGGIARGRSSGSSLSCAPSEAFFPALVRLPLRQCEAGAKLRYDRTLRTQVRTEAPLRFVEWHGRLVFDLACPSVFASYCESTALSHLQTGPSHAPAGAARVTFTLAEEKKEDSEDAARTGGSPAAANSVCPCPEMTSIHGITAQLGEIALAHPASLSNMQRPEPQAASESSLDVSMATELSALAGANQEEQGELKELLLGRFPDGATKAEVVAFLREMLQEDPSSLSNSSDDSE